MGRYAGADAPKSLMNLYGGIASVCSFYILFVFPEVWTVIRVISNDSAQLFGAGGIPPHYAGLFVQLRNGNAQLRRMIATLS